MTASDRMIQANSQAHGGASGGTSVRTVIGLLLLALLVLSSLTGHATAAEPPPMLRVHVSDLAGVLGGRKDAITEKVLAFEAATGHQVFVLTVPTTGAQSIEEFAVRAFQNSKIGQRKLDNGVLFVIATEDRKMRIEVGYGLEGVLTDAVCSRILNDIVAPQIKGGLLAAGIEDGVDAIIYDIDPAAAKPTAGKAQRKNRRPFAWHDGAVGSVIFAVIWGVSLWIGVIPFVLVVTLFAIAARAVMPGVFVGAFGWWALTAIVAPWLYLRWRIIGNSVRRYRLEHSRCHVCTWVWTFAFAMLIPRSRRARNGWSGDFSSSSSSSDGGGGGYSDSGGGGGESGGGGASASW